MSRRNVKTVLSGATSRPHSCSLARSPACRAYSPSAVFFEQADPEQPTSEMSMMKMYNKAMETPEAGHYVYMQYMKSIDHIILQEARDRVQKMKRLIEKQQNFTSKLQPKVQILPEIPAYNFDYHGRKTTLGGAYQRFYNAAKELDLHLEDLQCVEHKSFSERNTERLRRNAQSSSTTQEVRDWADRTRLKVKAAQKHLKDAMDDYGVSVKAAEERARLDADGAAATAKQEEMTPEEAEKARKADEARMEALKKAKETDQLQERAADEKRRQERQAKAAEERAQAEREAVFDYVADAAKTVFRKTVGFTSLKAPVATVPDAQPDDSTTTEVIKDDAPTVGWGASAPFLRPISERNRRITTPRFSTGGGGRRVRRFQSASQRNTGLKTKWGSGLDRLGSGDSLD
jgi:hypothetical protein